MEKHYQDHDGDNWGVVMIFLFIGLLTVKAMDFEIPWWIVTSPMWVPFAYLTVLGAVHSNEDS